MAHHPRRERRRLASTSPCPALAQFCGCHRAGRPGTSVRRNASRELPVSCPDPRGAAGEGIPPRRTSPRSRSDGAASGPRFCGFSEATPPGRCVRSGKRGAASRRSPISSRRLWGADSSVVADSHDQRSRRDYPEPWPSDRPLSAAWRDRVVAIGMASHTLVGTIALAECDRRLVAPLRALLFDRRPMSTSAPAKPAKRGARRANLGVGAALALAECGASTAGCKNAQLHMQSRLGPSGPKPPAAHVRGLIPGDRNVA